MDIEQLKEDLEVEWTMANINGGCNCLNAPPCNFCVSGYSLDMEEFVALELQDRVSGDVAAAVGQANTAAEDYDRAMKGIGF